MRRTIGLTVALVLLTLLALPQGIPLARVQADPGLQPAALAASPTATPIRPPAPTATPTPRPAGAATPTPVPVKPQPRTPRIVGGQAASNGQFPWAVSLNITLAGSGSFLCGGTLIDANWIMTAGHCVYDDAKGQFAPPDSFIANIGALDRTASSPDPNAGERRTVTQVLHHPGFNPVNLDNDVALLKLSSASTKTPITLVTPANAATLTAVNTAVTTVGWGYTCDPNDPACTPTLENMLRYVTVHMLADSACSTGYGSGYRPSMLCAGETAGGKDSCNGDSGGALAVFDTPNNRWIQVGIVSSGNGCAEAGFPGLYSRLPVLLNFITAALGQPITNLGNLKFITPIRVVDTRNASASGNPNAPIGFTPFDVSTSTGGTKITAGQLAANGNTRFLVAGRTFGTTTVPTDTTGVLLNVTIVQNTASGGFVTVYAGDAPAPPNASTVNPSSAIAANFHLTALGSDGTIAVNSVGPARDLAVDLVGYYSPSNAAGPGNLKFISPTRVLDTRPTDAAAGITTAGFTATGNSITAGPLAAGTSSRFLLAGKTFGGTTFPADLAGILAHVTIVQGGPSGGFVTLLPGDATGTPGTSTVNPSAAVAFNSWANGIPTTGGVGTAGSFGVYTTNTLDVAVDVVGYFAASNPASAGSPSLLTPLRVVDTRPTDTAGGIATTGFNSAGAPIAAGQLATLTTTLFKLSGQGFSGTVLPTDLKGALINVTIVQGASGGGFLTVFPGDQNPPNASTVNPTRPVSASFWATGLPTTGGLPGTIGVYSIGDPRDVIIDLLGYFR